MPELVSVVLNDGRMFTDYYTNDGSGTMKVCGDPARWTPSGLDEFHPDTTHNPESGATRSASV